MNSSLSIFCKAKKLWFSFGANADMYLSDKNSTKSIYHIGMFKLIFYFEIKVQTYETYFRDL